MTNAEARLERVSKRTYRMQRSRFAAPDLSTAALNARDAREWHPKALAGRRFVTAAAAAFVPRQRLMRGRSAAR